MKNSAEKFNAFTREELEVMYLALTTCLEFCDEDEKEYIISNEIMEDIGDILKNIKSME